MSPSCFILALAVAARDETAVDRGRRVYEQNRCRVCHSVAGEGNPRGPHDEVGSRLTAEQIREWVRKPAEMARKMKATRKPAMPTFPGISDEELDALVAYLQTLKKK